MSVKTSIWSRIGSAFERTDIAAEDGAAEMSAAVRPTATRYAPIRDAVERRVNTFLRKDLVSHLEIGDNELFQLHYLEIAADSQGAAELDQFLHEFTPQSRVQWVKKLLGGAVGRHVSVEQFLGLDKEFAAADLAETDPYEEMLNQVVTPPYRVILHGRWQSRPLAQAPEEPASDVPQPAKVAGPALRLSVQDGGSKREIEIAQFPATLGSSVHADAAISGYYVSARHCTLHWEAQQLMLADHSTNGTWVDGQRVQRGGRVALTDGAVLGFGRERGEGDYDRYPLLQARFTSQSAAAQGTPVAPSGATPVAPALAKPAGRLDAPLAVLAIVDATGSPRRDVQKLPFAIGRGSAQDYVVPDANQGVSREHLVIEEITASGAVTHNRAVAKNGTFAADQPLPERFVWRFGEEIVLGEKWTSAPVVRISLRQVEEPA